MKDLSRFLGKSWKKIVLFIIGVSVIYFILFVFFVYTYVEEEFEHIAYNDIEYTDTNKHKICPQSNCGVLVDIEKGVVYVYENSELKVTTTAYRSSNFLRLDDGLYLDKDFKFYYDRENFLVNIETVQIETEIWKYYFIVVFLFTVLFINILGTSLKEEREASLRLLMSNEAMLANKSMILITENIHHELNTPMEVIENKIDKFKEIVLPLITNLEGIEYEELIEDFMLVEDSAEAIHNILYRMKGFKHIRYSNGNKTLSDILYSAFKVISVSESNFSYFIDEDFRYYKISSDLMKNADLLNITINHIKNSLTACATEIHLKCNGFDGEHVFLRVIDNGNGIPKDLQKNIFEANFSTKDTPGQISGNGLYLNRSILTSTGGNVKLIESSIYGTTFELMLPTILTKDI